MTTYSKVILKNGKDEALKRFHLWIFSGAIQRIEGNVTDGSIVEVYSSRNEFLCMGHYNDGSIAVRIFSFEKTDPDKEFWVKKLSAALNYREKLGLTDNNKTNAYRLIFGEGDGLPGLIIDYYNGTAIIQCHSYGMYLHHQIISESLIEIYGKRLNAVYLKSRESLPSKFADEVIDQYLYKNEEPDHIILENGLKFYIDWEKGQKTGFFIDQRENREILLKFSKNRSVLNTFCYTGGFSVYALHAGAALVHSVDSSASAIELTDNNVALNGFGESLHKLFKMDVMDFLVHSQDTYDVIILDPPAYAKHLKTRHKAMQGYRRLNETALSKINKGGFLFTFSCSQVVDSQLFRSTIQAAAIQSKRNVRIVAQLSQPADHPINAFHPESEYLKGLVLFVE
jgi:23S rRNA (cytosine1962-C5)-methyltransferase